MEFHFGERVCLAQAHDQKGLIVGIEEDGYTVLWDDDDSEEFVSEDELESLGK